MIYLRFHTGRTPMSTGVGRGSIEESAACQGIEIHQASEAILESLALAKQTTHLLCFLEYLRPLIVQLTKRPSRYLHLQ